jgi:metal-sulfur cluster biosynthetic enzyme
MSESVDSHSGGPGGGGTPPGAAGSYGAHPPMDLTVSEGADVKLAEGEKLTPQHVLEALKPVKDPEILLSIVDLGLIYGVDVSEDGTKCTVRMTLTGPGCPVGPQILAAVHNTVSRIPCVKQPDVQLVWDPPWNPVIHASDEAKDALGIW